MLYGHIIVQDISISVLNEGRPDNSCDLPGATFYLMQFYCFIRLVSIWKTLIKMNCFKVSCNSNNLPFYVLERVFITVWCEWWWVVRLHWTMSSFTTNSRSNKKTKKNRKFRKNCGERNKLCNEDREFLIENTSFTSDEITEWHK